MMKKPDEQAPGHQEQIANPPAGFGWLLDVQTVESSLTGDAGPRVLTMVDEWSRFMFHSCVISGADDVVDELARFASPPPVLRCTNRPEFNTVRLKNWAASRGVSITQISVVHETEAVQRKRAVKVFDATDEASGKPN